MKSITEIDMDELYEKLKKYSLDDAIDFEKSDRQFLALEKLYKNKKFDDNNYLFLTITNAIVCYQLSGVGEEYWEEFASDVIQKEFQSFVDIEKFFEDFLPNSKNNKRFVNVKLKRIAKLEEFYNFITKGQAQGAVPTQLRETKSYYKNMDKLADDLAKIMSQKKDAKTIVFAVKMFGYASRNVFGYLEYFSEDLQIPIDSRLKKIYQKYNKNNKQAIDIFYKELSKKLNIPPLHLDALLWINYDDLMI